MKSRAHIPNETFVLVSLLGAIALAIRDSEAQRREALIPLGALSTSKKLRHFCAEYIFFFVIEKSTHITRPSSRESFLTTCRNLCKQTDIV